VLERPPCSRYENPSNSDDGDERVIATWAYALGLLGDSDRGQEITEKVARLHDHKGTLYVVTHRDLPEDLKLAFRRAWEDIGCEAEVEFVDVRSSEWTSVWSRRRFPPG
jgi:hypothetical protein